MRRGGGGEGGAVDTAADGLRSGRLLICALLRPACPFPERHCMLVGPRAPRLGGGGGREGWVAVHALGPSRAECLAGILSVALTSYPRRICATARHPFIGRGMGRQCGEVAERLCVGLQNPSKRVRLPPSPLPLRRVRSDDDGGSAWPYSPWTAGGAPPAASSAGTTTTLPCIHGCSVQWCSVS